MFHVQFDFLHGEVLFRETKQKAFSGVGKAEGSEGRFN